MRASAVSTNSRLVVRPAARSAASVARVGLVCAITLLLCPLRPLAGGEGGDPSLRKGEGEVGDGQCSGISPPHPCPLRPQGRRGSVASTRSPRWAAVRRDHGGGGEVLTRPGCRG